MVGPGLQVLLAEQPVGVMLAREQIWVPRVGQPGVLELAYAPGDVIRHDDALRLNIVDGKRQLPDKADVAPTEKARRLAQDKAMRHTRTQDKAEVL